MKAHAALLYLFAVSVLASCATETPNGVLDGYVERKPSTTHEIPVAKGGNEESPDANAVSHGRYLVRLLGCGSCHTHGALVGEPDNALALAGSRVGIAYTNPALNVRPGIVFPANLTPDMKTGIGRLSVEQVAAAIRHGSTRYGGQLNPVMPWWGYRDMSDSDALAIASYLKSIPPVAYAIPKAVPPGGRTNNAFVHFGVYQKR